MYNVATAKLWINYIFIEKFLQLILHILIGSKGKGVLKFSLCNLAWIQSDTVFKINFEFIKYLNCFVI